jgi:CheY-like chemotaxis protein
MVIERDAQGSIDPSEQTESKRLRVLVVDDFLNVAESLASMMRIFGHEAQVALDGATALDAARASKPDVILLDIGIPVMDGYTVAKTLRKQMPSKPPFIVAVTGYGSESDYRHSAESGINFHLLKPVNPDLLRLLLETFRRIVCD